MSSEQLELWKLSMDLTLSIFHATLHRDRDRWGKLALSMRNAALDLCMAFSEAGNEKKQAGRRALLELESLALVAEKFNLVRDETIFLAIDRLRMRMERGRRVAAR
jgi:hypothetical protein